MSSENTTADETRDEQTAASLRSLTLNEQPRHPDLEDDIPLLESFHRAQQQYQAIQDSTAPPTQKQPLIQQCIARFTQIGEVVRAAGLFSLNEELDDINTVDLQYLTVPYYMADLLMQVQLIDNERTLVMRHRFAALLQAVIHLKKFLDHCENLKLMNEQDIARYHRGGGHGDSRQSRIDAYKREQTSRELVTSLLSKRNASRTRGQLLSDDERENSDDERRYTLALIDWYVQKALDHLDMANREIPILKHGLTQETTSQQQPQPGITPQQLIQPSSTSSTSKPKVYRIDNSQAVNNPIPSHMSSFMHRVAAPAPQARALPPSTSTCTSNPIFQSVAASTIDSMASQRANIRDNVFRDSNPYTLTVEEWSAQQHAQHAPSQSQQFSIANARPSERRVEHKEEEQDEDEEQDQSEAAQDAATLKARNWDNWKDEHEKGIGNRMK